MKILLANTTAYPIIGGVENSLGFIARELVSAGHEAKIFCLQFSFDGPLRVHHEGIEIIGYPCKAERWPHKQHLGRVAAVHKAIPAVLDEFQPDAIWSRSASVGLGIRRSGYKGPLLQIFPTNAKMNCRGTFLRTKGLPVLRRLKFLGLWPLAYFSSLYVERALSRQCHSIAFSENMRGQLLAGFPKDARSCHVIPPGVDSDVFAVENGVQFFNAIEDRYGLNRKDSFVLYVGRLSSAKRIPLLMDAVSCLKSEVKLVLVGSGSEEARLKQYARRIGIANRIIFAGTQREMLPGFYAMSRVCVLPTTTESFGQVYLEALASGTPVVGFAGDGNRVLTASNEIILNGKTGAVVNTVTAKSLAEGIDSILRLNEETYNTMSKRCRENVIARFSWKHFVSEALKLSQKKCDDLQGFF
jgi:glycosyltransferase involved in cell wall biosynthesis